MSAHVLPTVQTPRRYVYKEPGKGKPESSANSISDRRLRLKYANINPATASCTIAIANINQVPHEHLPNPPTGVLPDTDVTSFLALKDAYVANIWLKCMGSGTLIPAAEPKLGWTLLGEYG